MGGKPKVDKTHRSTGSPRLPQNAKGQNTTGNGKAK